MKTAYRKSLRDYMTKAQLKSMENLPTYHSNCLKKTGLARPGKTARDRARKGTTTT